MDAAKTTLTLKGRPGTSLTVRYRGESLEDENGNTPDPVVFKGEIGPAGEVRVELKPAYYVVLCEGSGAFPLPMHEYDGPVTADLEADRIDGKKR